jgi:hypothetical protein
LTGNQSIEIIPKTVNNYISYTWKKSADDKGVIHYYPIKFDNAEFRDSFIWQSELIKKLVFFTLYTWCKPQDKVHLKQQKIFDSIGGKDFRPNSSIRSSISSYLDSGKIKGVYLKVGKKQESEFLLSNNIEAIQKFTTQNKMIIPSDNTIKTVKTRAKSRATRKTW